jgi:hypothetical protein
VLGGHKCAPTVQLQAIQELWEMLSIDSDPYSNNDYSHTDAQLHMIMSKEAISSGTSPKTLKFMGEIQDNSMVILVFFAKDGDFS